MISFWEKTSWLAPADLLIVGAGIVGLSAALSFREKYPSRRVVVLERGALPTGASTKNAGFACFGSISELLSDLETHAESEVFALVEKRWKGLQRLRERVGDVAMGYQALGGYELFLNIPQWERCSDHISVFNKGISEITGLKNTYTISEEAIANFGFSGVKGAIVNSAEGQLNPGMMMKRLLALAREKHIEVLVGMEVKALEEIAAGWRVSLGNGIDIQSEKVLIATNGFASQLVGDLALQPARNQVLITRPIPHLPWKGTFHLHQGYFSFRNVGDRVLLGGGRHLDPLEETTSDFGLTPPIQEALLQLLREVILPERSPEVEQWWSGILGVGPQKKPIVRWEGPGLAVAVRLGGMGVAIGSLVGEEAAELLADR
jgi:gamma-glutamylputrescine oxidase